jgi:hypothetical protein
MLAVVGDRPDVAALQQLQVRLEQCLQSGTSLEV